MAGAASSTIRISGTDSSAARSERSLANLRGAPQAVVRGRSATLVQAGGGVAELVVHRRGNLGHGGRDAGRRRRGDAGVTPASTCAPVVVQGHPAAVCGAT